MDEKIKSYLAERRVLIVEPSSTATHSAQQIFHDLGLPDSNFFQAKKFDQAVSMINELKPQIIISEYNIEAKFGLDLLKTHAEYFPLADERLFILLTKNSGDSAVAEAAEEDVDGYLLKPFSMDNLRDKCRQAILSKMNPGPYHKLIVQGKRLLQESKFEEASATFDRAILSQPKPCLAHYYNGKALEGRGDFQLALAQYQLGLAYNSIHYKCLASSFEVLDKLERATEAYQVIQILSQHFPVSPQRLGRMFWLAVQTKHYKDVASYYDLYTRLERRPPQLIRIVSAGLLVGGKALLQEGRGDEAMVCFRNAVVASGRESEMVFKVAKALAEAGRGEDAEQFLTMISPDDRRTGEFCRLEFKVGCLLRSEVEMIEKGRQLVLGGQADTEICNWTLKALIDAGYHSAAERVLDQIIQLFPDKRRDYNALFESLVPESPKPRPVDRKIA